MCSEDFEGSERSYRGSKEVKYYKPNDSSTKENNLPKKTMF